MITDWAKELSDIAVLLRGRRISIADFCRSAGIGTATFFRLQKGGSEPKISTWRRIESAVADLEGGADGR